MRSRQFIAAALPFFLAVIASGCGTPKEKTAPCKRPANLTSYAATASECGPIISVNTDRAEALAVINELAAGDKE